MRIYMLSYLWQYIKNAPKSKQLNVFYGPYIIIVVSLDI